MTNTKIEKEYKMMLNKQEFDILKAAYPCHTVNVQTNYYYDSKPSAYARGFSIRIRELNDTYTFTLKESVPEGKLEHEFTIDSLNIEDLKIKNLLNELHIYDKLELIGTLKTIRHIYQDEYGELCIDENHYSGIIDYEAEYELFDYKEDKLEHFKNILKKCNIEYIPNRLSKLKRFKLSIEKAD